ncbi:MAG: hypothetical protein II185_03090, partial [Firmicutes bacterium]|nr:hypothetical protein [Bacillota bacterium]
KYKMWIVSMIITLIVSGFIFIIIPPTNTYMYAIPIIIAITIMGGFIMYQLKIIKESKKD